MLLIASVRSAGAFALAGYHDSLDDRLAGARVAQARKRPLDPRPQRGDVGFGDGPAGPADPFFNANTPEELAQAERLLRR